MDITVHLLIKPNRFKIESTLNLSCIIKARKFMGKKQGNLQTSVYQILYSHHYDAPAFIKVIVNNAIDLFESNQLESATPFKMVGYSRRAPNTLRAHWNELKCR